MKTKIDIEKLLQWAMRDELPKGQAVAATPWDVITRYCALGVRVDVSRHGDGLGFVSGEPSADALRVADAIRALDTEASFADIEEVLPLFEDDIAGIAREAARMIARSVFDPRSIVISCAVRGARPQWKFEHPTPYQMFAPAITGKPRAIVYGIDAHGDLVEMKANRGRKAMRELYDIERAPRSPLNWHDPSPLHIGECRAEWVTWHHALVKLARDLAGALGEFEVMPPALPLRPWAAVGIAEPRIFAGRDLASDEVEKRVAPSGTPLASRSSRRLRPNRSRPIAGRAGKRCGEPLQSKGFPAFPCPGGLTRNATIDITPDVPKGEKQSPAPSGGVLRRDRPCVC